MMDKETYKKELMRMYAWVRDDDTYNMKECNNFTGKNCNECPIRQYCFVFKLVPNKYGMTRPYDAFEVIEAVERWSKEHPPKKIKISNIEYEVLKTLVGPSYAKNVAFGDFGITCALMKKGYFKGATSKTNINNYLNNCEVADDD